MAVATNKDYYVSINSVNESSGISSLSIDSKQDDLDTTCFGASGGAKTRIGGLWDNSFSCTFKMDFAAAGLASRIQALLGTIVSVEVRPTSGSVSTSNPKFTFSVLINDWKPLSGNVGSVNEMSVTWPISGPVTYATS